MKHAELNKPIVDFSFTTTTGENCNFAQFRGKNIILYFYPKDSTPGCTKQGCDFRDQHPQFLGMDAIILGVSRDSLKSHHKFKEKYEFPFELITDANEELCNYFNVIKTKNIFGLKVRGIQRSTFLIDKKGILRKEWRGVKVFGHVREVLQAVKEFD